jgi:hypothetical protein
LDYQVCYKSQIPLLHFINKINCSNVEWIVPNRY